jgi:hypothetical protein
VKHRCGALKPLGKRFWGSVRLLKELSKRSGLDFRATFPTSKVFDFRWPFNYRCGSEAERIFLSGRINAYLSNHRRGSFKLPSRFKDLVCEVSKMTKRQLREKFFWNFSEKKLDRELHQHTIEMVERILPQTVWRPPKQSLDALARRVDTHRLASRDWPRDARSLWPSFPSLTEVLGMSRQGKTVSGLWSPRLTIPNCVTWNQARESRVLATRMVQRNVVGIRSTVKVPREYLPWFRYSRGILFLTVRYWLPIGLVRFLTSEWIRCPYNLWLQVPCRYKSYLKLHDQNNEVF